MITKPFHLTSPTCATALCSLTPSILNTIVTVGEMNQALYAHMNNKRKMKKKTIVTVVLLKYKTGLVTLTI
jgi:hypothetical protein